MQSTSIKKIITALSTLTALLIAAPHCDDPVTPPPPPGPLELLAPLGGSGKSVSVGDTVTIRWSIHDKTLIPSVGISYSLDGGETVTNLQFLTDKSFSPPDTSFRWIVDSTHISERFVVIVWEYHGQCYSGKPACESPFDKSEPFAVRK